LSLTSGGGKKQIKMVKEKEHNPKYPVRVKYK
jgi:hypothetical protein